MTPNQKEEIYITTQDFLVSHKTFHLLKNPDTEMLSTLPQPKIDDLPKYYDDSAYISHTDSKKGLISFLYQKVKKNAIQKKLNLIFKMNNGMGSLLDMGAGTGEFLKKAGANGWEIYGVEPNENARKLANAKGIFLEGNINYFEKNTFDVITLWHVLEHLPDLKSTIMQIEKLLKPGGTLIIAVPNYKSYDAKFYGKYWAGFDVPRHLWHFSKKSMRSLFSGEIILEKTLPLYFDSFYVSLLSEKYKTKNEFSLKALWVGLISNLFALKTGEYSSLIYCFRKSAR